MFEAGKSIRAACASQAFSGLRASADLGGHPVFDEPDTRRQDRAGDAAACELANECADVHGASRLRKQWNKRSQNLPTNTTANRAGDCVACRSKAEVLRGPAGHIATDGPRNNLNDEIDQHTRHESLLTLPGLKFKS